MRTGPFGLDDAGSSFCIDLWPGRGGGEGGDTTAWQLQEFIPYCYNGFD